MTTPPLTKAARLALLVGDNRYALASLDTGSVQCIATSPPYFGLRLYGDAGEEIGKERDLVGYVSSLVDVMRECRRVLRDDGVAWVNLGDSYSGSGRGPAGPRAQVVGTQDGRQALCPADRSAGGLPDGNALLVPFRVAAALQADGWTLRAMLPWVKLASMPESVQSRPSMAHEYVLFLTKKPSGYFYDADAVRVTGSCTSHGAPTANPGAKRAALQDIKSSTLGQVATTYNPSGRSLRSSDFWRAGAREAAEQLLAAANGEAVGMLTNDDHPAALVVNPKGSGIPHFAMWPTRLVAPMILAGTPEAGSCSVCGAPWERVVERTEGLREAATRPKHQQSNKSTLSIRNGGWAMHGTKRIEQGFRPSCAHTSAPSRPAVVLDPFAGAGTTLAVAECLGREGWGCELYQKNADLYPQRLDVVRTEVAQYLRERAEGDKAAAIDSAARGQLNMFGGVK